MQIAVLFHDSAREDEGEDLWDHESATFLYFYLTRILKIPPSQAKELAEAAANKDWLPGTFYLVMDEMNGEVIWSYKMASIGIKMINHLLIHDVDCLDVIRARDRFDGKKLILCQYVNQPMQHPVLDEIAELIIRARSLIAHQGDAKGRTRPTLKKGYENEHAYSIIVDDIHNGNYLIFEALYANGELLSVEQLEQLTLIDRSNILNQQRIFARGMVTPTAFSKKMLTKNLATPQNETLANLEFRKTKRRKGVLTTTSKTDGLTKEGNPNRSVSLLGSSVFTDVGALIFNPDNNAIKEIYETDGDTGWGKKKSTKRFTTPITFEELERIMKLGGSLRYFAGRKHPITYCEILYDVTKYDAIYYTFDPTIANERFHESPENTQPNSPILKAIYIQFAYQEAFGIVLPIYEYSGIHHYLKKIPQPSEEQIIQMWSEMCSHFMKNEVVKGVQQLASLSISEIMSLSMYKEVKSNLLFTAYTDASINYPENLAEKIKNLISETREKLIADHKNRILERLSACINTLKSIDYLPNKTDIFQTLALAGKADLNLATIKLNVSALRPKNLQGWHLSSYPACDALVEFVLTTCEINILQELNPGLPKFKCINWLKYYKEELVPTMPFYAFDRLLALHKIDEIDLAEINILEITDGTSRRFTFLNALSPDNQGKALITDLLKSQTTQIPSSETQKTSNPIAHCTFFQPEATTSLDGKESPNTNTLK